jgi:hypothetical protein
LLLGGVRFRVSTTEHTPPLDRACFADLRYTRAPVQQSTNRFEEAGGPRTENRTINLPSGVERQTYREIAAVVS